MKIPKYYMFIDESGDASLNNRGKDFFLSTVIVERTDFEIIQGYLRLLKRRFFGEDHKILHATDLFERPYQKYRKLCTPTDRKNAFIHELRGILDTVPYHSCVYHIDKDALRKKLSYKPVKGRKPAGINIDLPYEIASKRAIIDFTKYLKSRKATGEIVIESRLHRDSNFVTYFDNARKPNFPGGLSNPFFRDVLKSIPSLFISNKDSGNIGLEIVDIVSYVHYRKIVGDPFKRMKLSMNNINILKSAIKRSAHIGSPAIIVHHVNV